MKKLLALFAVLIFAGNAYATDPVWTPDLKHDSGATFTKVTVTLSANASAVAMPVNLKGAYIFQGEVSTSADDTIVFTVNSALGNPLYSITTTAGTSASATNISQPEGFYVIGEQEAATYTISGLGSGTATVSLTGIYK